MHYPGILLKLASWVSHGIGWLGYRRFSRRMTLQVSAGDDVPFDQFDHCRVPCYPILVHSLSDYDHLTVVARLFAERLRVEHVACEVYRYSIAPRLIASSGGSWTLGEVHSHHDGAALLLVGDGSEFFAENKRSLADWTKHLKVFSSVMLLTPVPMVRWSTRERALTEAGIVVLPCTVTTAMWFALWSRDPKSEVVAPALNRAPAKSSLLRHLELDAPYWYRDLAEAVTDEERAEREAFENDVVEAISCALPPETFELACMLALYPVIRPDLTVHVAERLTWKGRGPFEYEGFGALASLPWFRYAGMPVWLSAKLATRLSPERRAEAFKIMAEWESGLPGRWVTLLAQSTSRDCYGPSFFSAG